MTGYAWSEANTQQGRERLKELFDSGMSVAMMYETQCVDGEYGRQHCFGYKILNVYYIDSHSISDENDFLYAKLKPVWFLDPSPRLEPIPLEWHHLEMGGEAIASSGDWLFYACNDGDWEIRYDGEPIAGGETMDGRGNFDTAKAAIHDWRVNILKSMTGGAKP